MATGSSIPAWEIPWIEEPGGLQAVGPQSWTQLSDYTHALPQALPALAPLVLVAQPGPTLCNPMDCSLPGISVHGFSTPSL